LGGAAPAATFLNPRKSKNAMPTPVFPTAYKVEVFGQYFGQLVENVWYCQGPDPFDPSIALGIAAIFQTNYANIANGLSQDISFTQIDVQNLGGVATGTATLVISPPQAGSVIQDGMPGNVAFCVSLRTALAGRRFRGRKYFSGLGEGDVTGNTLDTTAAGNILSGCGTLLADLATNGTPLSVFSPTGLTLVPVTSISSVDFFVDSQRRRLTGRGR
jgi:hypothetical protein